MHMASDPEKLVQDWQAVLKKSKEMEIVLEKFFENLNLKEDINPRSPARGTGKDLEYYAEILKDKGDAVDLIVLSELLGRHIVPLANLVSGKSTIDYSADEWEDHKEEQREAPVLSAGAQAIADGFERLLDGQKDPRMSYGKIPAEHQINRNK